MVVHVGEPRGWNGLGVACIFSTNLKVRAGDAEGMDALSTRTVQPCSESYVLNMRCEAAAVGPSQGRCPCQGIHRRSEMHVEPFGLTYAWNLRPCHRPQVTPVEIVQSLLFLCWPQGRTANAIDVEVGADLKEAPPAGKRNPVVGCRLVQELRSFVWKCRPRAAHTVAQSHQRQVPPEHLDFTPVRHRSLRRHRACRRLCTSWSRSVSTGSVPRWQSLPTRTCLTSIHRSSVRPESSQAQRENTASGGESKLKRCSTDGG